MHHSNLIRTLNLALGTAGLALSPLASAIVTDGNYAMVINNTPMASGPQFGSDGNWNSSFTLGCLPGTPNCTSQYMYDNGITHNSRGSSIANDGVAGVLNIFVTSNTFTVSSFNVDAILNTPFGDLVQYTNTGTGAMSGVISGTSMTFDPTGRLAAVQYPVKLDRAWNIDTCDYVSTGCRNNGNTSWSLFTTGTVTTTQGSFSGTDLVNIGDVNGDGIDDYTATLVSGGRMGPQWDAAYGAAYYEAWNLTLLSQPIPVPAAAWLFGSGLLGLMGVARRRLGSTSG